MEDLGDLSFAGEMLDDEQALQVALGNVNLRTMRRVHDFDPDAVAAGGSQSQEGEHTRYGRKATHASVWQKNFDPANRDPEVGTKEFT